MTHERLIFRVTVGLKIFTKHSLRHFPLKNYSRVMPAACPAFFSKCYYSNRARGLGSFKNYPRMAAGEPLKTRTRTTSANKKAPATQRELVAQNSGLCGGGQPALSLSDLPLFFLSFTVDPNSSSIQEVKRCSG